MLTKEEILAKYNINSLLDVKNINCWGSDLNNIDIINEMKNVRIISLSLNKINSLKPFENLENLEELYLRKNEITDINEINYLKNCKNLKILWLEENPICDVENYRKKVINTLPFLIKLDNVSTTVLEINKDKNNNNKNDNNNNNNNNKNENNNNKENENNNNNKKNENKKINNEVKYYYKILGNECLLVKNLLEDNGFIQTVNNNEFSILWASGHIKLNVFPYCEKFQKLNHFPRSGELTRKDLLYKNLSKLKASFPGSKFDFLPISFLIPNEIGFLNDEMKKDNNKKLWIIKPCASSQGRGIYLTNNIKDIDGNYKQIASKYIDNPFTINKKKFDLRIYVLVTSIVPLKIYRFNEGLTRFATDNYNINIYDKCSHLTNYAINKNNKNYIQNENLENNNYNTSKWSLTQFKNFLNSNKINSDLIFNKIDDIIIKTLISVENNLFTAMEKYTNFYNNCFELFGFDILIDENLNPWLMEVNLSPNLHYDSPIDLKIKGEMIAEIFDIIRIVPYDMRNENIYENNNKFKEVNKLIKINELKDIKFNKEIKEKIWDYIEEVKRLKGFIKLFPNKKYNEYKKFFDKEREINVILGILENKYN